MQSVFQSLKLDKPTLLFLMCSVELSPLLALLALSQR